MSHSSTTSGFKKSSRSQLPPEKLRNRRPNLLGTLHRRQRPSNKPRSLIAEAHKVSRHKPQHKARDPFQPSNQLQPRSCLSFSSSRARCQPISITLTATGSSLSALWLFHSARSTQRTASASEAARNSPPVTRHK